MFCQTAVKNAWRQVLALSKWVVANRISDAPSPISQFDFDAAGFPAHTRRMAKNCANNQD